jgi:hypothetical protein
VAYAYLLGGLTSFEQLGAFPRLCLAQKVFGPAAVEAAAQRVAAIAEFITLDTQILQLSTHWDIPLRIISTDSAAVRI